MNTNLFVLDIFTILISREIIITATNTFGVFITPTMRANLSINTQIHILGTNLKRIVSRLSLLPGNERENLGYLMNWIHKEKMGFDVSILLI